MSVSELSTSYTLWCESYEWIKFLFTGHAESVLKKKRKKEDEIHGRSGL